VILIWQRIITPPDVIRPDYNCNADFGALLRLEFRCRNVLEKKRALKSALRMIWRRPLINLENKIFCQKKVAIRKRDHAGFEYKAKTDCKLNSLRLWGQRFWAFSACFCRLPGLRYILWGCRQLNRENMNWGIVIWVGSEWSGTITSQ